MQLPTALTPLRVLVVDDYPDAAQMSCEVLRVMGHTCVEATSGESALAIARTFAPDLVILDIGLPDISGYELAPRVRALAGDRPIVIAALTGWGAPADLASARAAGFDHHVVKPTTLTKLAEIVAFAMKKRPASA
jgi:CheY-like chemotaxis protein